MADNWKDKAYNEGVESGLKGDFLDDFSEGVSHDFAIGDRAREEARLRHEGYIYGRDHRKPTQIFNWDNAKSSPKPESRESDSSRHTSHDSSSSVSSGTSSDTYPDSSNWDDDYDDYYSSSSSYDSSARPSQKGEELSPGQFLFLSTLAVVAGIGLYVGYKLNLPKKPNVLKSKIVYDYKVGQSNALQERHRDTMSFNSPDGETVQVNYHKSYRGEVGLKLDYLISTPEKDVTIAVQIPDEQITEFHKLKGRQFIKNGQLMNAMDYNTNRMLCIHEVADFYDFTGREIESRLESEGFLEPQSYFSQHNSEKTRVGVEKRANEWIGAIISNYIYGKMPYVDVIGNVGSNRTDFSENSE